MADTTGPPHVPGLEARVARLEADVAHMRSDLADVRFTLNRLAPVIDEMHGFLNAKLPELATKAELANLRSESKAEWANLRSETSREFADIRRELTDLRLDIVQRPTRRQAVFDVFAIVGLIGAVLTIASHFAR